MEADVAAVGREAATALQSWMEVAYMMVFAELS